MLYLLVVDIIEKLKLSLRKNSGLPLTIFPHFLTFTEEILNRKFSF